MYETWRMQVTDTTVIAIVANILMCMHGEANLTDKCPDGADRANIEVTILKGTLSDRPECKEFNGAWTDPKKCINSWDSVLEIRKDKKLLFQLKPDGTTIHDS